MKSPQPVPGPQRSVLAFFLFFLFRKPESTAQPKGLLLWNLGPVCRRVLGSPGFRSLWRRWEFSVGGQPDPKSIPVLSFHVT